MAPKTTEPPTEPPKADGKPAIRADISEEMDDEIEKAVALMKLRGDKDRDNRSKLIRSFVEKGLKELAADVAEAEAAVRKTPKPTT